MATLISIRSLRLTLSKTISNKAYFIGPFALKFLSKAFTQVKQNAFFILLKPRVLSKPYSFPNALYWPDITRSGELKFCGWFGYFKLGCPKSISIVSSFSRISSFFFRYFCRFIYVICRWMFCFNYCMFFGRCFFFTQSLKLNFLFSDIRYVRSYNLKVKNKIKKFDKICYIFTILLDSETSQDKHEIIDKHMFFATSLSNFQLHKLCSISECFWQNQSKLKEIRAFLKRGLAYQSLHYC